MSVFTHSTAEQMGITISPGESFNLLANNLGGGPIRLTDLTPKPAYKSSLPPAVVTVPPEHIRGYVHNKKVNQYLVGSNLGEGSFAKVKEAFHVMVGEKVAMKVIDKKKAMQDPYVAKNFKREAKLLQMVRHPNILQLLEVIETDSSFYLITELCSGGELMKYIYKKGQLDESETRKFMRQIVSAVDHMHKAGIIHRDLKVENMLLDANMDIKIIDFGLSNEEYVQGENGLTHCSTQCGSPAYAAPELLGHKTYGPQVDIWSIGVNMYAMLTGCLPYTVEPFNITALHAKMLENKMNPIPDHLSEKCKDLLKQLLRSNPSERLSMPGIMSHPWMNEGHTLPFGPAPFPNKLQLTDINSDILQHMVYILKLKDTEDEMRQELVSNRSTQSAAIYYLLLARLARYNKHFPHAPRVRHKRVSRDQGFYEEDERDEDIETQSIKSTPTRRPSRHSNRPSHGSVPFRQRPAGGGGKDTRPISHPSAVAGGDQEDPTLSHTMPAGYNFRRRRQTMPEFMLKEDVLKARESQERKERATEKQEDYPKQSTRPSTRSTEKRKRHTHPNTELNAPDPGGSTTLAPVRLPHSMRRNHYSTPSALNQIREHLNSKLGPTSNSGNSGAVGGIIHAWHSNPNSHNPSRNPSRQGSRHPSGQIRRAASNNMIHTRHASLDADDSSMLDQEDLVFHDVRSSTLPRSGSKKKIFMIGQDSPPDMNSFTDHSHLPSISEVTAIANRKRSVSDGSPEKRNGFSPQTKVVEVKTELGVNEVLTEIMRAAHSLKMRDIEQIGSSVMFSWNGVKFQVSISRVHSSVCRLTYQWLSGGDLQKYMEKCDKLSRKLKL